MKGRAWQGFSADYPGAHVWAATPTDYNGQHVQTNHDIKKWHTVEYVFPVGDLSGVADCSGLLQGCGLTTVHFMLEGEPFPLPKRMSRISV